jgi:inorganic triphosphatase YgiF
VHHLEAVYFDTPEFALADEGIELRIRREAGGEWVQTIKLRQDGACTGMFDRAEHESPLREPGPKFTGLPKEPGFDVLRRKRIRKGLRPVFATRVERRIYHLAGQAGGEIELAIDVGRLSAGRRTAPLCELELEAKGETPENLFRLAEALSESVDLRPETRGKADLGYALLRRTVLGPEKANAGGVRWDSPKEEVFASILENALRQMRAKERLILETGDPEAVHQMRVALRRLRACLSSFRKELPGETVEPVRESLRAMLDVLGPARDWEVFVADRLGSAKLLAGHDPRFASVVSIAEKERSKAWTQVRKLLASREYSRTILRLTGWIACRRWREEMNRKELRRFRGPVGKMAVKSFDKGHRSLCCAGAHLAFGDDASWHELRIAIKRQRYSLDSFRSCFPAKATSRYVAGLESLQDALGGLQDLATGKELLAKMGRGRPESLQAFLAGFIAGQAGERAYLRERVFEQWSEFAELKRPWHDSR